MTLVRTWCWTLFLGVCIVFSGIEVGSVLAQASLSETGPSVPNFWADLWDMAKAAGALGTGILGLILYRVDKERIKYRDDYFALVERVLPLIQQGVNAQEKLGEVLSSPKRRT